MEWLFGTVRDSATDRVLPGVTVTLTAPYPEIGGYAQEPLVTMTDINGRYAFVSDIIPPAQSLVSGAFGYLPGFWQVTFAKEGYHELAVARDITLLAYSALDTELAPKTAFPWWLLAAAAGVGVGLGASLHATRRNR